VIHNAEFDVGFLEYELELMKHPKPSIIDHAQVLDTLSLARELHPGQRNSLDALCKRYEVDASNRDLHGALIDADLLARVYLAMTGGQTALFLDESETNGEEREGGIAIRTSRPDLDLVVIRASEAENAAHEAMLEKLRQAGECVWDRLGDTSQAAK
jgi:DNA polymerase-3 subunit epsilon